jgi:predicted esterase
MSSRAQTQVQVHTPATLVHGRYLLRPPVDAGPPAGLLVGFHGYGETAEDSLSELERIPGAQRWLLVAIQGLSRFYTRQQAVVASWMTRQDRDLAIEDNVRWVASVVGEVRRRHPGISRLVYAGFSQGVAMAYRAAVAGGGPADAVLALAGDVPPELAERPPGTLPRVLIGRGSEEQWYTEEKLATDLELLRRWGIEPEIVRFDGGHEWTDDFRRRAGELLDELAPAP